MEIKGKKLLIVDDEEDLCEILQHKFEKEGFAVSVASSAEEALVILGKDLDLIILDVMMGRMSGFEMAEKLRKEGISTPIIFLTARDAEDDILKGFNLGADDYIAKPFSINELTARVKAILKRSEKEKDKTKNSGYVKYGHIALDTLKKRVEINNNKADLTKKEYEILKLLLENQNRIFSREDILEQVWGKKVIVTDRTVDVNITRLRTKLGECSQYLKNKTGLGYYIEFQDEIQ